MRKLEDGIKTLNEEGGGLLRVEVIRPEDVVPLRCAAFAGSYRAASRLAAVHESAQMIKTLARKKPAICLCCPRTVRDPHATLALLCPAADRATVAIASPVCQRCSACDREELLSRAAKAYQDVWPNLRCVEVTHPEGARA